MGIAQLSLRDLVSGVEHHEQSVEQRLQIEVFQEAKGKTFF
jgi:hypothetical protein